MPNTPSNRWPLIKKLVIFQVKLALDAIRDLFLSPISFGCALIDIIKNNNSEQSYFNKLMSLGGKTDTWLNLFGQHHVEKQKSSHKPSANNEESEDKNVDQLFDKIETLLREQHAKGGVTIAAKHRIDNYLTKLNRTPTKITTTSENEKNSNNNE